MNAHIVKIAGFWRVVVDGTIFASYRYKADAARCLRRVLHG